MAAGEVKEKPKWVCPTCRRWVQEPMAKQCENCRSEV